MMHFQDELPIPRMHRWFGAINGVKRPRTCFVMMPFSSEWSDPVWEAIHAAFAHEAVNCVRADSMRGPVILRDIVEGIAQSSLLLADITDRNPNVFYEIGIAHAWELDVLMITQEAKQIPFDTSSLRHIVYETSAEGLARLNFLLRQVARTSAGSTLTPLSIEIMKPAMPTAGSNFLGQWEGSWTGPQPGKLAHTLVVYALSDKKASVVYFSGNSSDWLVEAGYRYIFGRLVDGALLLEWPDVSIKYQWRDDELFAEREDLGRMFYCTLKRIR
jgi:hypothetical protein